MPISAWAACAQNNTTSRAKRGTLLDELVDLDDRHQHGEHDGEHYRAHGEDEERLEECAEREGAALGLAREVGRGALELGREGVSAVCRGGRRADAPFRGA